MAVRKIKNSWWVDFRADYVRYRRRSPDNTKAGAEAYEAMLRQKLARGERIDKATWVSEQEQLLERFAPKWFEEYVLSNNKPSEQRAKKYILRESLVPFFGKMPIGRISSNDIERFKVHEARRGIKNKTINNRLTALNKCLATAYEWLGITGASPKIKWLKCAPVQMVYLTLEEASILLSYAGGIVYELLVVALYTGMRQGELRGLQWSSIDWVNHIITVRHSRCDYTKTLTAPKSNRERHIPMHDDIHKILVKRKKETGYVFLDHDNHIFDEQRLRLRLKNVRNKAGLKHFGWHALRHTFASHLVMMGIPLTAVKELMGHSSITTTMRYAHLAPSTLQTAVDLLGFGRMLKFGQPVGNQWLEVQQKTLHSNPKT